MDKNNNNKQRPESSFLVSIHQIRLEWSGGIIDKLPIIGQVTLIGFGRHMRPSRISNVECFEDW